MKPRRKLPITVRVIGTGTFEFAGNGGAILSAMQSVGCRYMRARQGGAWQCPAGPGQDVLALLEHRGHQVQAVL